MTKAVLECLSFLLFTKYFQLRSFSCFLNFIFLLFLFLWMCHKQVANRSKTSGKFSRKSEQLEKFVLSPRNWCPFYKLENKKKDGPISASAWILPKLMMNYWRLLHHYIGAASAVLLCVCIYHLAYLTHSSPPDGLFYYSLFSSHHHRSKPSSIHLAATHIFSFGVHKKIRMLFSIHENDEGI